MESVPSHNGDLSGQLSKARNPRAASPNHSPTTSPPYWTHSHARSFSNISVESVPPGAITLLDNTEGSAPGYDKQSHCWAKGVHIDDFVVINGSSLLNGLGSFVVWNVAIETLNVCQSAFPAMCMILTYVIGRQDPVTKAIFRVR